MSCIGAVNTTVSGAVGNRTTEDVEAVKVVLDLSFSLL